MQCNIGAGGGCDAITARVDNLMGVGCLTCGWVQWGVESGGCQLPVVDTCGSLVIPGTGRLGNNGFRAHLGVYSGAIIVNMQ